MTRAPILPILVVIGVIVVLFSTYARGNDYGSLLGQHWEHAEHGDDPYRDAVNQRNHNCCHGRDCVEFYGTPEKVNGGWQFGPWFVEEWRAIKPETLARRVRGLYVICFQGGREAAIRRGSDAHVYCGHAPETMV